TAIVISADHGEAMGEQGVYGDHVCAGEAVHNIPMIVRWPGAGAQAQDRTQDGLLYNVDFHPTLCDLLDIPTPSGWDGASFAAAVRGEAWSGRPYLVWDHALYTCQRAVRTPEWLFIRSYHPGLFPFDDKMLFDMRDDPHQTVNLAAERPEVAAEMDAVMQDWLQDALGRHGSLPDPLQLVIQTGPWKYVTVQEWIPRLRAKGRDADADAILARLGLNEHFQLRGDRVPF
ncbi:MAG: sulfatase-like hydrolase/transferase, partial [Chloroflexia bacterium]|nr:sulfatase-like hydrolase/transferase [Chloroflexia bacterium]